MSSVYSRRRIARLIDFRSLHSTIPVPVRQLVKDEGWHLQFRSRMHPLYGFAVMKGSTKLMVISEDIDHVAQRYVMAHELGHELAGDLGGLHMCGEWAWQDMKSEVRADEIAARLLIPDWAMQEYSEVAAISAACEVPEWLVHRRCQSAAPLPDQEE